MVINLIILLAKYILLIFLGFTATIMTIITLLFIALGLEGIIDFFRYR